ncbi:MAG TPA: histidine ammonia-lyase [Planctomycetota bacterium]|nr:histidine ammonia-lyase [Planctomycetota bacterium]
MLKIDGNSLRWQDVLLVARATEKVALAPDALTRIVASRKVIEDHLAAGDIVYGVSTGFGKFATIAIDADHRTELQKNLVRSHAAGVGELFPTDVVRAMLLLRANALAKGASGVRPEVVETLLAMLNARVHPLVPQIGSLGASGDLIPLAHIALVAIGEGEAELGGVTMTGAEALANAGIRPLELQAKEGLALLNGTQAMCAMAALLYADSRALCKIADISGAMSIDATLSSRVPCDEGIHALRPYAGTSAAAANIRKLLAGSQILASHEHCKRVQDPYSLRCLPQVHGATREAVAHVASMLEIEMNAATDNPLVLGDGRVVSGGNFHGQPIALRMDYLGLALHELGSISERRVDWIMNPNLTDLPAFLSPREGLHSGYMIAQYTAAALVSENKTLCGPSSADTIPVSGNQEDHNSMGLTAARRARMIFENVLTVLAIECLCAAQAIDLRRMPTGAGLLPAMKLLRRDVPRLDADRVVASDIQKVRKLLSSGELIAAVESEVGELN